LMGLLGVFFIKLKLVHGQETDRGVTLKRSVCRIGQLLIIHN